MPKKLTLVAVGDSSSEKTRLLIKYTRNPHKEYLPLTFIDHFQKIIVDSTPYSVYFMDANPDDTYKILRKDIYQQADTILLCYSIKDRESFDNAKDKWIMEIRTAAPHTPIVLVATTIDARNSTKSHDLVSSEEGINLKLLTGAAAFAECSVTTCTGIDNVFIEAVRSTYPKGCCTRKKLHF